MADLHDLILQNLAEIHQTQRDTREEMNRHFGRLNGRISEVEEKVGEHDKTLNKVKGAVAAVATTGTLITFFHEKWDGLLKLLRLT